ncbi:hypothetical protein [Treponema pedis]|uniref:hypothetical protein n=1 Tax=Treponema pedis TaxID=409322 RepID=UPI003140D4D1
MAKNKKAKDQSRKAIILASLWVLFHSIVKALFPAFGFGEYGLSMQDIITSGSFFIVGWVPVYGSIWLDKFFKHKDEPSAENESEEKTMSVIGFHASEER